MTLTLTLTLTLTRQLLHERSVAAVVLGIISATLFAVFMDLYTRTSSTGLRTLLWLGYKALVFGIVKIYAKIAYFGTGTDVEAMLLVFAMVMG